MSDAWRGVLGAALLVLFMASRGVAQEREVLHGRIADAQTSAPLPGAFVAQEGSKFGVLTDSLGVFSLELSADFPREIRVAQLGYRAFQMAIPPSVQGRALNVGLVPNPIEIEGLKVLTDQLADRRRGLYGIADVLTGDQLRSGGEGSGYDLVRRVLPLATPCGGADSERLCLAGRVGSDGQRSVTVCIDDHAVAQDFTQSILDAVDPRGLYMVESYSRMGEVRMYTRGYMQRLIASGQPLPPLTFGCSDPVPTSPF